ncbi:IS110 family transposase [Candidatus Galacturonibacter soehngenii]|uniref:IS110 family transposase n=1 Tax=Candidatus Galacturonatibacter soehngenii TaxID=2307010 RepID=A0A7V7QHQ3_9FIRM|nr:IS110 family transposase [Candidatus Galacturonibacter soehngenii]KAB1434508.1 IS110 family transposase [Candidatus Galacturonibacter soehngenii]KAB1438194.1 IS110 family transposase [Candidatus Galacturonibacter soehngenii]
MKVIYQTCCGVDVHKSFLVATIIKTTSGVEPTYQKKRFSTFNNSILEFKQWLIENECRDICMESTGKYWVPVFNLLEEDINVTIANPKWVKAVKGNKDDTKDSKWIGNLFRLGLVPGSYIPCKPIRILREYTRYRYKMVCCRSGEKNRYQNALTVCNVALDSVVSDIFGKSSTSIIDYLLEQSGNSINHEEIASKLLKKLKEKEPAVIESIEGYQMTDTQKYRMRLVRAHMDYITAEIQDIDSQIEFLISSHADFENAIQFLCTIPGVKRDSAITIISEIGIDMSQFSSNKRLCSWAGLTPGNNESAGKKKSVRITRAGVYLKPALVQCAHAAVKSDKSPYYKKKYESLLKRRGKKRAIIAIARMILTAIYQMLSNGEVWNPSDIYKIDMPVTLVEKQKEKAIKQAKKLLLREGVITESQLLS